MSTPKIISAAFVAVSLAGSAAMAVPISFSASSSTTGFTVSSTDLLSGIVPTVNDAANVRTEESRTTTDLSVLTNGVFGPANAPQQLVGTDPPSQIVAIHNGTVLSFALNTVANTAGYDITSISSFTGWNDNGRDDQEYSVSYSVASNPNVFLPLTVVSFKAGNTAAPSDLQVALGDTPLATNVAALQFTFPTTENGFVGYREFDAAGTASAVPEPASAAILGLAALPLLRRRR